jgi:hypothetical protein
MLTSSKDNNQEMIMSKKAKPEVKSEAKAAKAKPNEFLKLMKLIVEGDKPRGLKVVKNEVGGYTFTYGLKSAPISIIASDHELASFCLSLLGLKLVKAS